MTSLFDEDRLDRSARFSRQQAIPGWSQEVLEAARILVVGAGALGNETLKNLALLGVDSLTILDREVIEQSNLSRGILFRDEDVGQAKARVARERLRAINPHLRVQALQLDLMMQVGSGLIAEHDLVLGCLDSIEARWKLNRLCRAAAVPWIDAGIAASLGQIAFFAGDRGPCYECGITAAMWEGIHQRRSCLLAQQVLPPRRVATTATIASLLAALQVQEAVAQLHHLHARPGSALLWPVLEPGDRVTVSVSPYSLSVLHAKSNELCLAHEEEHVAMCGIVVSPGQISAAELLRHSDAACLELDWDVAMQLACSLCGPTAVCMPAWAIDRETLLCPVCNRPRTPLWTSRIARGTALAESSLAQLGVPAQAFLSLVTTQGHRLQARLAVAENVRA